MASVSFNGNAILRELDLTTQVQLPFLAAVTVNKLATEVRKDLQKDILSTFTYVNSMTYKSPQYRHFATIREPWTYVELRDEATKGQAPAQYLLPQIKGGLVLKTRFQNRLGRQLDGYNGAYMLPWHGSPVANLNQEGRIRASQYVEVLYGVKAMEDIRARATPGQAKRYRTEGKYQYVPYVGNRKALYAAVKKYGRGTLPDPGIYRVVSDTPVQLFKQLERMPTVRRKFDFVGSAERSVQARVQAVFNRAVAEHVKPQKL